MMKRIKKATKYFKRWYRRYCFSLGAYSNTGYVYLGRRQMSPK
jgi:hypothetical protein